MKIHINSKGYLSAQQGKCLKSYVVGGNDAEELEKGKEETLSTITKESLQQHQSQIYLFVAPTKPALGESQI